MSAREIARPPRRPRRSPALSRGRRAAARLATAGRRRRGRRRVSRSSSSLPGSSPAGCWSPATSSRPPFRARRRRGSRSATRCSTTSSTSSCPGSSRSATRSPTGSLPLWSDSLEGGSSPWVNPQSGALSPIAFLARPLPIQHHLAAAHALKMTIALEGAWLLASALGARPLAAALGGLGLRALGRHPGVGAAAAERGRGVGAMGGAGGDLDRAAAAARAASRPARSCSACLALSGNPEVAAFGLAVRRGVGAAPAPGRPLSRASLGGRVARRRCWASALAAPVLAPFLERLPAAQRLDELALLARAARGPRPGRRAPGSSRATRRCCRRRSARRSSAGRTAACSRARSTGPRRAPATPVWWRWRARRSPLAGRARRRGAAVPPHLGSWAWWSPLASFRCAPRWRRCPERGWWRPAACCRWSSSGSCVGGRARSASSSCAAGCRRWSVLALAAVARAVDPRRSRRGAVASWLCDRRLVAAPRSVARRRPRAAAVALAAILLADLAPWALLHLPRGDTAAFYPVDAGDRGAAARSGGAGRSLARDRRGPRGLSVAAVRSTASTSCARTIRWRRATTRACSTPRSGSRRARRYFSPLARPRSSAARLPQRAQRGVVLDAPGRARLPAGAADPRAHRCRRARHLPPAAQPRRAAADLRADRRPTSFARDQIDDWIERLRDPRRVALVRRARSATGGRRRAASIPAR